MFAPGIESEDSSLYDSGFGDTNVHPTYEKCGGEYVLKNRAKLEKLLDRLAPFKKTGRILDIGCSVAFFLHLAKDRGWEPQGVEIAKWASDFSRQKLGVEVFNGLLQDAKFPDSHFDVVFSSHVMEHIGKPLELLREMARVLRPGGAHVTVVPTQFAAPSWLLRRRFTGDPPPIHASFYTPRTYRMFLEQAGLSVQTLSCNIELSRLRDLLKPEHQVDDEWRQQKEATLAAGVADSTSTGSPAWLGPVKSLINWFGTQTGIGDEMLVIAEKPAH